MHQQQLLKGPHLAQLLKGPEDIGCTPTAALKGIDVSTLQFEGIAATLGEESTQNLAAAPSGEQFI